MKKIVLTSLAALSLFILASCGGNSGNSSGEAASAPAASGSAPAAGGGADGEAIYKRTCVACHQPNGMGIANTFPPLAKSDFIANREMTIGQVIKGKQGELVVNGAKYNSVMPPQPLNDAEIAAVLTYVYTNFGNSGAPVTVDEVKAVRAKL